MKFQRIHTWVVLEEQKDCVINAALSPLAVAEEFCFNNMPKELRITGLYRLVGCDDFKRYEDGNECSTDILAVQLNFGVHSIIADLGGRTLPILLVMEGKEAVFTEAYNNSARFISKPDNDSLIKAVMEIDAEQNGELMLATLEKGATDWFNNLCPDNKAIVCGSEPADDKWQAFDQSAKIALWRGTYYIENPAL